MALEHTIDHTIDVCVSSHTDMRTGRTMGCDRSSSPVLIVPRSGITGLGLTEGVSGLPLVPLSHGVVHGTFSPLTVTALIPRSQPRDQDTGYAASPFVAPRRCWQHSTTCGSTLAARFDRADDLRLSGLESDDAPNGRTRRALDVTRPACSVECENGSSASTVRYPRW
ncbi:MULTISPECIES: hypothetical protein [unclassified Pseudonocardia]|uniref:hypothetical protein n=2 Tax=Pseudonocardia TaxID=1847 RepID=UPI00111544BD|nr:MULTISPECIES: hypothetical protein [unclassified Pseudonocardia]